MSDALKSSVKHGLEGLVALVLIFAVDYFLSQIVPQLPQTPVLLVLVPMLGGLLKYLRANPNIKIPDYVNEPVGRARR